jgi:predicted ester cyclase
MSEKGIALIQRNYEEIWSKGNLDLFDLSIDQEIVRHHPPFPDVYGLQAYKEYIQDIRGAMSDISFTMEDVIFMEDRSSARVRMSFIHTGQTPGLQVPATGRQVTLVMGIFSRWKGDKIVEEWAYIDYLGFLQQLGVLPPMDSAP